MSRIAPVFLLLSCASCSSNTDPDSMGASGEVYSFPTTGGTSAAGVVQPGQMDPGLPGTIGDGSVTLVPSGTGGGGTTGGETGTGGNGGSDVVVLPPPPEDEDTFALYSEGSVGKYFEWGSVSGEDETDGSLTATVITPTADRNAGSQGFGWFVDSESESGVIDVSAFSSLHFNVELGADTELVLVGFSGAQVDEWAPFAWPTPGWLAKGVGEFDYYAIGRGTSGDVAISLRKSLSRLDLSRLNKFQFVVLGPGPVTIRDVRLEKGDVSLPSLSGNKFDPGKDKTYLMIGQETAGIENYWNSSMPRPAGLMHYMSVLDGWYGYSGSDSSIGEYKAEHFWVDEYEKYKGAMAQIGLSVWDGEGGGCSLIAQTAGALTGDAYAAARTLFLLEARLKSARRPVFLRIGYEFDNPDHSCGGADAYKNAYRRIVDYLTAKGVNNVAYVWHPFTQSQNNNLEQWWPGNDYVDWVGASVFTAPSAQQGYLTHNVMHVLGYAQSKSKPLAIAESTPQNYPGGIDTEVMNNWFGHLFDFIESAGTSAIGGAYNTGGDVRMFSYIHSNWSSFPHWQAQGGGAWINTLIPAGTQQTAFTSNLNTPQNSHQYITASDISFDADDASAVTVLK